MKIIKKQAKRVRKFLKNLKMIKWQCHNEFEKKKKKFPIFIFEKCQKTWKLT